MHPKKKLRLRFISAFLCATFIAQELHAAPLAAGLAPSLPPQEQLMQTPEAMDVPLDFAQLSEVHRGSKDVFIIHIQDAHSNVSGQQNLSSALDALMEKYGVRLVLSEGGEGDCSLTSIKKIASPAVWKRVAKSFLLKGEIQGEEYLNLVSDHPMKIVGVEDMTLYDVSLSNYAELAERREKALAHIQKIVTAVDKLKNRFYAKPLLDYEAMKKSLVGFEKTFPELLKMRAESGLGASGSETAKLSEALNKEMTVNFGLANLERGALLEELHQKGRSEALEEALSRDKKIGKNKAALLAHFDKTLNIARENGVDISKYENLNAYMGYLKTFAAIEMDVLLGELEAEENELYEKELQGDAALLRSVDRFIVLLKAAHEIKMTTQQHDRFKAAEPDFGVVPVEGFLNRKLAEQGYFDDMIPSDMTLDEARKAIDDFYDSVSKRDVAFVGNVERAMKEDGQKVAFLITGGYHTDHLKKLLKENGFGYAVLTPLVTSETNQKKYEALIFGNRTKQSTLRTMLVGTPQAGARLEALANAANPDMSKRDFLKKSAALVGAAAITGIAPENSLAQPVKSEPQQTSMGKPHVYNLMDSKPINVSTAVEENMMLIADYAEGQTFDSNSIVPGQSMMFSAIAKDTKGNKKIILTHISLILFASITENVNLHPEDLSKLFKNMKEILTKNNIDPASINFFALRAGPDRMRVKTRALSAFQKAFSVKNNIQYIDVPLPADAQNMQLAFKLKKEMVDVAVYDNEAIFTFAIFTGLDVGRSLSYQFSEKGMSLSPKKKRELSWLELALYSLGGLGAAAVIIKDYRKDNSKDSSGARLADSTRSPQPFADVFIKGGSDQDQEQVRMALLSIAPMIPRDHADLLQGVRIVKSRTEGLLARLHIFDASNITVILPTSDGELRHTLALELGHMVMARSPGAMDRWNQAAPGWRYLKWYYNNIGMLSIAIGASSIVPVMAMLTSTTLGTYYSSLAMLFLTSLPLLSAEIQEKIYQYKNRGSGDFVTDYARTNPAEDFAETYMHFALSREQFRDRAEQNPVLNKKYEAMGEIFENISSGARLASFEDGNGYRNTADKIMPEDFKMEKIQAGLKSGFSVYAIVERQMARPPDVIVGVEQPSNEMRPVRFLVKVDSVDDTSILAVYDNAVQVGLKYGQLSGKVKEITESGEKKVASELFGNELEGLIIKISDIVGVYNGVPSNPVVFGARLANSEIVSELITVLLRNNEALSQRFTRNDWKKVETDRNSEEVLKGLADDMQLIREVPITLGRNVKRALEDVLGNAILAIKITAEDLFRNLPIAGSAAPESKLIAVKDALEAFVKVAGEIRAVMEQEGLEQVARRHTKGSMGLDMTGLADTASPSARLAKGVSVTEELSLGDIYDPKHPVIQKLLAVERLFEGLYGRTPEESIKSVYEWKQRGGRIFLATDKGETVGYVAALGNQDSKVRVLPERRSMRIGFNLMLESQRQLIKDGYVEAYFEVWGGNENALRFHQRSGPEIIHVTAEDRSKVLSVFDVRERSLGTDQAKWDPDSHQKYPTPGGFHYVRRFYSEETQRELVRKILGQDSEAGLILLKRIGIYGLQSFARATDEVAERLIARDPVVIAASDGAGFEFSYVPQTTDGRSFSIEVRKEGELVGFADVGSSMFGDFNLYMAFNTRSEFPKTTSNKLAEDAFYVQSDMRETYSGLGRGLLSLALEVAAKTDPTKKFLVSSVYNEEAKTFYWKFGFRKLSDSDGAEYELLLQSLRTDPKLRHTRTIFLESRGIPSTSGARLSFEVLNNSWKEKVELVVLDLEGTLLVNDGLAEGAEVFLEGLRDEGVERIVVTTVAKEDAEKILDELKIRHLIGEVLSAKEGLTGKSRVISNAIKARNLRGGQVVASGDSPTDAMEADFVNGVDGEKILSGGVLNGLNSRDDFNQFKPTFFTDQFKDAPILVNYLVRGLLPEALTGARLATRLYQTPSQALPGLVRIFVRKFNPQQDPNREYGATVDQGEFSKAFLNTLSEYRAEQGRPFPSVPYAWYALQAVRFNAADRTIVNMRNSLMFMADLSAYSTIGNALKNPAFRAEWSSSMVDTLFAELAKPEFDFSFESLPDSAKSDVVMSITKAFAEPVISAQGRYVPTDKKLHSAILPLLMPKWIFGPGEFIGKRYQVISAGANRPILYEGAVGGAVYKVRDLQTGQIAALKTNVAFWSSLPGVEAQATHRAANFKKIERESAILRAVTDSGGDARMPRWVDYGATSDEFNYVVMELIEGGYTPHRFVTSLSMNENEASGLALDYLSVLEKVHAQGFVYNDVRPDQMMIREEDGNRAVTILDYGNATEIKEAGTPLDPDISLTEPSFKSPEEKEQLTPGVQGDLYKVALLMFRFMKREPAPEKEESVLGSYASNFYQTATAAQILEVVQRSQVSEGMRQFLIKGLSESPEDRFQSAAEMRRELERVLATSGAPSAKAPEGSRLASGEVYAVEAIRAGKPWIDALKGDGVMDMPIGFVGSLFSSERPLNWNESKNPQLRALELAKYIKPYGGAVNEVLAAFSDVWSREKFDKKFGNLAYFVSRASQSTSTAATLFKNAEVVDLIKAVPDVLAYQVTSYALHINSGYPHSEGYKGEDVYVDNRLMMGHLAELMREYVRLSPEKLGELVQANALPSGSGELTQKFVSREAFMLWSIASALNPDIYPSPVNKTTSSVFTPGLESHERLTRPRAMDTLIKSGVTAEQLRRVLSDILRQDWEAAGLNIPLMKPQLASVFDPAILFVGYNQTEEARLRENGTLERFNERLREDMDKLNATGAPSSPASPPLRRTGVDAPEGSRLAENEDLMQAESRLFASSELNAENGLAENSNVIPRSEAEQASSMVQQQSTFSALRASGLTASYLRVGNLVLAHDVLRADMEVAGFPRDETIKQIYSSEPIPYAGPYLVSALSLMINSNLKGKTVLDYGTSDGALSLTALKLGAKRVVVFEEDPAKAKRIADNHRAAGYVGDDPLTWPTASIPTQEKQFVVINMDVRDWFKARAVAVRRILEAVEVKDIVILAQYVSDDQAHQDLMLHLLKGPMSQAIVGGYVDYTSSILPGETAVDIDKFRNTWDSWVVRKSQASMGITGNEVEASFGALSIQRPVTDSDAPSSPASPPLRRTGVDAPEGSRLSSEASAKEGLAAARASSASQIDPGSLKLLATAQRVTPRQAPFNFLFMPAAVLGEVTFAPGALHIAAPGNTFDVPIPESIVAELESERLYGSSQAPTVSEGARLSENDADRVEVERIVRLLGRSLGRLVADTTLYDASKTVEIRFVTERALSAEDLADVEKLFQSAQRFAGGKVLWQIAQDPAGFQELAGSSDRERYGIVYMGKLTQELLDAAQAARAGVAAVSSDIGEEMRPVHFAQSVFSILVQRMTKPTSELNQAWENLRADSSIELTPKVFGSLKTVSGPRLDDYLRLTFRVVALNWRQIMTSTYTALKAIGSAA